MAVQDGQFVNDDGTPVQTVSAEQHVLTNQTHVVRVLWDGQRLSMSCSSCPWWDEQ